MKKILLLNPPGRNRYLRDQHCSSAAKADYYWPAADLLVLSGMLHNVFEIKVIDAIVQGYGMKHVLDIIREGDFYAVIALTSSASRDEDFALFAKIKSDGGPLMIANGGFLREKPADFLERFDFLDALILDYTQKGIIDFLVQGPCTDYPGLGYRRGRRVVINNARDMSGKEFSYPMPRHELFPLRAYRTPQARRFPFTCAIISSGCPYACRFCSSAGVPFRLRNRGDVLEELIALRRAGISEIHFPDFTFTADREHAAEICRAMIKEKTNLSWDCLTRADCFDAQLAGLMKRAGCHTIQFGVESKNETVLRALAKPIKNSAVKQAFSLCKKEGIETIGFFIIGLPGEDEASMRQTIGFARELDCDYAAFSVFVPDFGSALRGRLEEANPHLKDNYSFDRTKFPVLGNEFLSRQKIWLMRNQAVREFYFRPGYVWKRLRSIGNFRRFITACKIFWSLLFARKGRDRAMT
ncbi:MAG: B12-binding domain-containing radical SAM protein [Candidatus Omnitrophica bacterium]|nr:B12-binding domain-containing radical SAM protein [Candidatus Omnitrophota bacterium]MBU4478257.1 B12-binding domain-containing radical SAM protein [Candidatus Omnitrophota bacterium]MCG2703325.1 B12-binding domain-containing radical SAM protein [Candidatus Omnitrophota bacterium]